MGQAAMPSRIPGTDKPDQPANPLAIFPLLLLHPGLPCTSEMTNISHKIININKNHRQLYESLQALFFLEEGHTKHRNDKQKPTPVPRRLQAKRWLESPFSLFLEGFGRVFLTVKTGTGPGIGVVTGDINVVSCCCKASRFSRSSRRSLSTFLNASGKGP